MPDRPDTPAQSKKKQGAFEQNLQKLQAVVESLERGDLSLEQSLEQYEQGTALVASCQKELESAQQRMEKLAQQRSS